MGRQYKWCKRLQGQGYRLTWHHHLICTKSTRIIDYTDFVNEEFGTIEKNCPGFEEKWIRQEYCEKENAGKKNWCRSLCPSCGKKISQKPGIPCYKTVCTDW